MTGASRLRCFYTFAGYSIYRCSMMTVVQISLVSFGTSFSICSNVSYDARCICYQYDIFSNIIKESYYNALLYIIVE